MKKLILMVLSVILLMTGCSIKNNEATQKKTISYDTKFEDKTDFINELALHDAIRTKNYDVAVELINKGINIKVKDKYGYTPLHLATRMNQYQITQLLIEKGANVNNVDIFKDTPLLDSTRNSTNPISKLLLCNGANRYVVDKHDMSPLHNASKNEDLFIVKMIQTEDIRTMCENIDITLDSYNKNENKICGSILKGVPTEVNLTIVDENSDSLEPFGKYETELSEKGYCANLDKPLVLNNPYLITAIGTNGIDTDTEIASLNDLSILPAAVEEPVEKTIQEAPVIETTDYITGLYEDLMAEFKDDFLVWNAELDKNGLVFRFKKPSLLFNSGKSNIKQNYKEILENFFPRYLNVINKYRDEVNTIVVEGHTSSVYKSAKTDEERYMKNKILSDKRANEVMNYTLSISDEIVNGSKDWLSGVYSAEGKSYDDLIYNIDGTENLKLSRRVDFRINKIMGN